MPVIPSRHPKRVTAHFNARSQDRAFFLTRHSVEAWPWPALAGEVLVAPIGCEGRRGLRHSSQSEIDAAPAGNEGRTSRPCAIDAVIGKPRRTAEHHHIT